MADPQDNESFWTVAWSKMKAALKWVGVRLMAPGVGLVAAAVVIVLGIILVSMGFKELQIGGLLGWLLGKKSPEQKAIDTANSVPAGRVDKDGKIIPIGTSDSKGDTQAVVVPIQNPGLFSNPNTVTFTPPGSDAPIEVQLPDGVKNKDVDKVIVVKPSVIAVSVKDGSGVSSQQVDDLLKKYGG